MAVPEDVFRRTFVLSFSFGINQLRTSVVLRDRAVIMGGELSQLSLKKIKKEHP